MRILSFDTIAFISYSFLILRMACQASAQDHIPPDANNEVLIVRFVNLVASKSADEHNLHHVWMQIAPNDTDFESFHVWMETLRFNSSNEPLAGLAPEDQIMNETLRLDIKHEDPTYLIVATALHVSIFVLGLLGNVLLIFVVRRSELLRKPMYMYVVSMAYADLLVTITAIPEAILTNFFGQQWLPLLGAPACPMFVFLNFFGINAGVAAMFTLTFERYVAICRPLVARKLCTPEKTRKIVLWCWLSAALYSCPWLALTTGMPDAEFPGHFHCHFSISQEYYVAIFAADLVLFYCVPLAAALLVYIKVNSALKERRVTFKKHEQSDTSTSASFTRSNNFGKFLKVPSEERLLENSHRSLKNTKSSPSSTSSKSGGQVVRMLMVIVLAFAVMWLPYRGLLLVNAFIQEPWLDPWYMLFAKCLIYFNSAINPILYNVMSARFRHSFAQLLCRGPADWMDKMRETKV